MQNLHIIIITIIQHGIISDFSLFVLYSDIVLKNTDKKISIFQFNQKKHNTIIMF